MENFALLRVLGKGGMHYFRCFLLLLLLFCRMLARPAHSAHRFLPCFQCASAHIAHKRSGNGRLGRLKIEINKYTT